VSRNIAVICLNNDLDPIQHFIEEIESNSIVIACDGAYERLLSKGIEAHLVIGDFDSTLIEQSKIQCVLDKNQDMNDFEKALNYAGMKDIEEIIVFGLMGGDPQHEFSNLMILFAHNQNIRAHTPNSTFVRLMPRRKYSIRIEKGSSFSLFTNDYISDISVSGAKYSLDNRTLSLGSRGLHNESVDGVIQIEYSEGCLILLSNNIIRFE
jgi:thiamine pyrophosphokinase